MKRGVWALELGSRASMHDMKHWHWDENELSKGRKAQAKVFWEGILISW